MLLTSAVFPHTASAGEWKLLELSEAKLNYKYFVHPGRDPLFSPNAPQKEELNLHVNTHVARVFYWDNIVHAKTNDAQYHVVGWNLKLGMHLHRYLDVQYEHFSRHLLDEKGPSKFPVEDSIGVVLYLYRPASPSRVVLK